MAKQYEIAKYLTREQRRQALAHTYRPTQKHLDLVGPCPRDEDGWCPLGRAIGNEPAPGSAFVVQVLREQLRAQDVSPLVAMQAALTFINDWDEGILAPTELAEALDVTP